MAGIVKMIANKSMRRYAEKNKEKIKEIKRKYRLKKK